MNSISFVGSQSGDGECFCWREVQRGDKIAIIGQENYDRDRNLEEEFRKDCYSPAQTEFDVNAVERTMEMLYPGDVMQILGVERDKKYKFTVTAEEIK